MKTKILISLFAFFVALEISSARPRPPSGPGPSAPAAPLPYRPQSDSESAPTSGLADKEAQARTVAQNNGARNASTIAAQLANAFGPSQNTAQLLATAKALVTATPDQAKAIAAAAAVFNPDAAADIAAELAKINPSQAAAIAAAVAAVVPAQANAIVAAVSAAVPNQANAIASAVSAGAGNTGNTGGFGNNAQFNSINPANFNAGATPSPTPNSPSN